MKSTEDTRQILLDGSLDTLLSDLAGGHAFLDSYKKRLLAAIDAFEAEFGQEREIALFSAPGRTELGGNHTDHQQGHVLAASIHMDMVAVVALRHDRMIRLHTEGYGTDEVCLDDLAVRPAGEEIHAAELIRGVVARFGALGYPIDCGFDAYTVSSIPRGAGLSSSAAFEVLIGQICNTLFADGAFSPLEIAKIGQYAENVFYHKPCGLMDQMASSIGGIIAIDFRDTYSPQIEDVKFDFSATAYTLCIVDVGSGHTDLTAEYAAIPAEMNAVAAHFGANVLSSLTSGQVLREIPALRAACGDRAVLRAMHYFREDSRAQGECDALERGDFEAFLRLVQNSGDSSYCLLQNVYPASAPEEQPVSIAIALGTALLGGRGAIRVHGGGFGGTVQAFVPKILYAQFVSGMEKVFGKGCCHEIHIRPVGGTVILK